MEWKDFVKHAVVGGIVLAVGESFMEKYLLKNNIVGYEKKRYHGTCAGILGGSVLGYYVGEKIAGTNSEYTLPEKIISSALGAAGGGLAGMIVAHYVGKKMHTRELP